MGRKPKGDLRKPEILDHFYEVLREEGYAGATLEKVATRMGVHSSLLVHYFKTKEELVVAVFDQIAEKYYNHIQNRLLRVHTPKKRFETIINTLFSDEWTQIADARVFYGSCLDLSFRNKRIKNSYRKSYTRFKDGIMNELSLLEGKGLIKDIDLENTAVMIISMLEGMQIYYLFGEMKPGFKVMSNYLKMLILKHVLA